MSKTSCQCLKLFPEMTNSCLKLIRKKLTNKKFAIPRILENNNNKNKKIAQHLNDLFSLEKRFKRFIYLTQHIDLFIYECDNFFS